MRETLTRRILGWLFFALLLPGLGGGCSMETLTQRQLYQAYEEALAATEPLAEDGWENRPERLAAVMAGLQRYYADVTVERVREMTAAVYAGDAYLCDTLHIARGVEEISAYFTATAERLQSMEVTIFDYSAVGREVYARWSMTIQTDTLAGGEPLQSYGMSHFRFDRSGKVVLHQDFWDASAGFFEHLPGLGGVVTRIRGRL